MKTLFILRHAKSSWSNPAVPDHRRPLNKRGKRDAPRIGQLVRDEGLVPDLILCSTAKRAYQTADMVADHCDYQHKVERMGSFYLAAPAAYLEVLSQLDHPIESVMVVGHNPGLEELLDILTGADEVLPTAALAHVALDIVNWSQVRFKPKAILVNLWRPRELDCKENG